MASSIKKPLPCTLNNKNEEQQETQKKNREIENKGKREDKQKERK